MEFNIIYSKVTRFGFKAVKNLETSICTSWKVTQFAHFSSSLQVHKLKLMQMSNAFEVEKNLHLINVDCMKYKEKKLNDLRRYRSNWACKEILSKSYLSSN